MRHTFLNKLQFIQIQIEGIFNISTNISELQVDIFSAIGKKITSKIINRNEEKIDLGNQASGVYFIKLTSNKNIELRKIIIK